MTSRRVAFVLLVVLLFQLMPQGLASGRVYVALWFDTEDYMEPSADDAALRIANDLTAAGVRATFKVVGEKARVLESRGRTDVIRALSKHAIGFHSNWHSVHPAPAEYLRTFGYLEGADEFERREGPGAVDVKRIFNVTPVAYGQPGSSWGPQSNLALRRMHIPIYLDEGDQVGLREQPFWYGGLLYVFNMGRNQLRAPLDANADESAAYARFDEAASRLRAAGGGVISIYYHPTEFVTTEFWDAVNFSKGAVRDRQDWVKPKRRSADDSERCYRLLKAYVAHIKQTPDVQFIAGSQLLDIYDSPVAAPEDAKTIADHLSHRITFLQTSRGALSAADMLLQLLGIEPQTVDGPTAQGVTTYTSEGVPIAQWKRAVQDATGFIRRNHRLPSEIFMGAATLSLADFTATLAGNLASNESIRVMRGNIEFEKYFSTDAEKSFNWVIHPPGFAAPELLDLGRLQGWTLKPAVLRRTSSVDHR